MVYQYDRTITIDTATITIIAVYLCQRFIDTAIILEHCACAIRCLTMHMLKMATDDAVSANLVCKPKAVKSAWLESQR